MHSPHAPKRESLGGPYAKTLAGIPRPYGHLRNVHVGAASLWAVEGPVEGVGSGRPTHIRERDEPMSEELPSPPA